MMVEPNYQMNIARQYNDGRYHHYCDIELGCIGGDIAKERYAEFCERFPKNEGWLISLDKVSCSAETIVTNN